MWHDRHPGKRKSKKLQWCFAASRVRCAPRKRKTQEVTVVLRCQPSQMCTPERGKTRNFSGELQENAPSMETPHNAPSQKRGGRTPPAKKLLTSINKAGSCRHPSRHHISDIHPKNKNPQKPPNSATFQHFSKEK